MTKQVAAGALGVVIMLGVAGCGGGGNAGAPAACITALDQADAAFTTMSTNLTTIKQAFDEAAAGDPSSGTSTLQEVQRIDASPYKNAEAECRAKAK